MKPAPNEKAEKFRNHDVSNGVVNENAGVFQVRMGTAPHIVRLNVIVSDGGGWDHVSVSLPNRCPTWAEMCFIKDLFFKDDEVVMQLHPAKKDYRNFHPNCLHLWRPQTPAENAIIRQEYMKDREHMTEEMRQAYDPIELAPCPNPIPLPPGIMVGPKGVAS